MIPLELGVAQWGVIRFAEGWEEREKGCMKTMGEGCGTLGFETRQVVTGGRRRINKSINIDSCKDVAVTVRKAESMRRG